MAGLDCYRILGVPMAATAGEIRKAYHKGALKWHPDKNPGHRKDEAERRFKQLSEAYEALKDPVKRASYDRLAAAEEGIKRNVPAGAARATGCAGTGGAKRARGAGPGRAPGAARATGCAGTRGAKRADGAGTGRAPGAAKTTGCAGTSGAKRPGVGGSRGAAGAGRGVGGAKGTSGSGWGGPTFCATGGATFYPTGGAWSTGTGESERNDDCYRYRDSAWAGEKLYHGGAWGGDDFYNGGAGDNFYTYVWNDDLDGYDYYYDDGGVGAADGWS